MNFVFLQTPFCRRVWTTTMMTRRDRMLTRLFPRRRSLVNTPPCSTPQTTKGALLKNSRMQNFAPAVEKRSIVFFYIIANACITYMNKVIWRRNGVKHLRKNHTVIAILVHVYVHVHNDSRCINSSTKDRDH